MSLEKGTQIIHFCNIFVFVCKYFNMNVIVDFYSRVFGKCNYRVLVCVCVCVRMRMCVHVCVCVCFCMITRKENMKLGI